MSRGPSYPPSQRHLSQIQVRRDSGVLDLSGLNLADPSIKRFAIVANGPEFSEAAVLEFLSSKTDQDFVIVVGVAVMDEFSTTASETDPQLAQSIWGQHREKAEVEVLPIMRFLESKNISNARKCLLVTSNLKTDFKNFVTESAITRVWANAQDKRFSHRFSFLSTWRAVQDSCEVVLG